MTHSPLTPTLRSPAGLVRRGHAPQDLHSRQGPRPHPAHAHRPQGPPEDVRRRARVEVRRRALAGRRREGAHRGHAQGPCRLRGRQGRPPGRPAAVGYSAACVCARFRDRYAQGQPRTDIVRHVVFHFGCPRVVYTMLDSIRTRIEHGLASIECILFVLLRGLYSIITLIEHIDCDRRVLRGQHRHSTVHTACSCGSRTRDRQTRPTKRTISYHLPKSIPVRSIA